MSESGSTVAVETMALSKFCENRNGWAETRQVPSRLGYTSGDRQRAAVKNQHERQSGPERMSTERD